MADVCSKLPRRAVSKSWREALKHSLQVLEGANGCARALACHLTLFSPNRREFFVPGRPQDFLDSDHGPKHEISRVVVLIDDIYDMYARLSGPHEVFNEWQQTQNYNDWVTKLSGHSLLDEEGGKPELLKFEVRRRSLESLAAWRRAELVQAEALANALGSGPLTVLGVKHHLSALEALVLEPGARAIYLSHKITEARRFNKTNPGTWPPFVQEVNSLSVPFQESGMILLHPTAIDELRTASSEQRVGLTDRWPLQNDTEPLIYVKPGAADAPEYSKLLGEYDFDREKTRGEATAIFRGFELGVFHDIASRDHLLVSSSEGLVLYRPVVVNGKDSGGARAEVQHWLQRWIHESEASPPRLVAMHTFQDMTLRLEQLVPAERLELSLRVREALQDQGFDRETAGALVEGSRPPSQHLIEIYGGENIPQELENAAGVALMHCFLGWLCNVFLSDGRTGAALVAAENAEDLRSPEMVDLVARLLKGSAGPVETTIAHVVSYAQAAGHASLIDLARDLIAPSKPASALGAP